MTGGREEAVKAAKSVGTAKTVETAEVGKDGEESKDEYLNLAHVPCIRYPIILRRKSVLALLDSSSESNIIYPIFAQELKLPIRPTDGGEKKINGTMLDTYKMVVTAFLVTDKANQLRFFEEIFLVANINPEIVFGILFLTLSGADVDFLGQELC